MYYPRRILVPTVDKSSENSTPKIPPNVDIREFFVRSRIARCRSRFVVPVILFDGKVRILILFTKTYIRFFFSSTFVDHRQLLHGVKFILDQVSIVF